MTQKHWLARSLQPNTLCMLLITSLEGKLQVQNAASLQAVANIARVLKPGSGRVLVRDYAEGDLAQLRLDGPTRHQRISENFFARSDGTQAYYFTQVLLQIGHPALCHSQ